MCQNLFAGRTVENVVEIIILFRFFPIITSKYVYQLSEKTLFLSVFWLFRPLRPSFSRNKILFVLFITEGFSLH